jgi:hypothetical protein
MSHKALLVVLVAAGMLAAAVLAMPLAIPAEADSGYGDRCPGPYHVIVGEGHYLMYDARHGDTWIYFPKKSDGFPEWQKVDR